MTDDVDYSGAKAPFINCTLKKSPPTPRGSSTPVAIVFKHGVSVELIRAFGHDITTGVNPDMREHGWRSAPAAPPLALSGV